MRIKLFVITIGFVLLSLTISGWTQKGSLQDEGLARLRIYKTYAVSKIVRPATITKAVFEDSLTDKILNLTIKYTFTKDTTKSWNGLKQVVYTDKEFIITEIYNPNKVIKQGGILLGSKPVVMIRRK